MAPVNEEVDIYKTYIMLFTRSGRIIPHSQTKDSVTQVGLKPFFNCFDRDAFSARIVLNLILVNQADVEVPGFRIADV